MIYRWHWYQKSKGNLLRNQKHERNYNVAKNKILFVGDGMGLTTITAARILRGQHRGQSGEETSLAFDKFEHVALAKVRSGIR
ncbi:alkaline phosphatase, tissue-nonspecific isozyme-like [Tachypleus tridentatus]|uniref:alkaline phosphatase, tissue-nonspecific isozyme-like n=1 Tax=Tachypleus tridentatus TaxID=6853 RepID=UPI003FD29570